VSARSFAVFIAVLALIALLGFGVVSKSGESIALGDPVPDKRMSFLGRNETGRIADFHGKWVLVNFWASWCPPCRQESPALQRFYRRNRDRRFLILGINLGDNTVDAIEFVRRYRLTYPILREGDINERRKAFGMTGFPESFLVDPRGRLALIRRGPVTDAYLREFVSPMLPGTGSS
jgi:cytochrome c biogenesis protein CcmG/thiol:disulfide interchange protein DsbE